ncbi:hypothetical protein F5H01DRAFT_48939 [Linnemannia elongata]|nr:hypothetical protein F5H01DRAFT_48939 [Linnemannia elongata]
MTDPSLMFRVVHGPFCCVFVLFVVFIQLALSCFVFNFFPPLTLKTQPSCYLSFFFRSFFPTSCFLSSPYFSLHSPFVDHVKYLQEKKTYTPTTVHLIFSFIHRPSVPSSNPIIHSPFLLTEYFTRSLSHTPSPSFSYFRRHPFLSLVTTLTLSFLLN